MNIIAIGLLVFLSQISPASIQGIVTRSGASEPLSKAIIELRDADGNGGDPYTVTTTEDGRFIFPNLQPGRYRLVAMRQGYVQQTHKEVITIARGQQITGLQFSMTQTAAIYGRIFDRAGRPSINATVQALQPAYPDGKRVLKPVQTAITNDLGEYRLFWLPPGSYFLSVLPYSSERARGGPAGTLLTSGMEPRNEHMQGIGFGIGSRGGGPDVPRIHNPNPQKDAAETFVTTYFPGTTDQGRASAIDLRPGANFGNADISIAAMRTRRIRGTIINGFTRQPVYAQLRVARAPAIEACASSTVDRENCRWEIVNPDNGTFDIARVVPGVYVLYAMAGDLMVRSSIEVGSADIDNLVLTLLPGVTISGRIDPPIPGVTVQLSPGPPLPNAKLAGTSMADGTFSVHGLAPGDYAVNVPGFKGGYVRSIRSRDTDVLNDGLRVTGGANPSLEIILGTKGGMIEGRILNSARGAAIDATVVLVPAPALRHRPDLYRVTRTDESGRYQFQDIAPGSYTLFAWERVEPGAWRDAVFIAGYADRGTSVQVDEGSSRTLDGIATRD